MQEAYNELVERPEGNPSHHYFKGSVKDSAEKANSIYAEALKIIEMQEIFDLGSVEETPEEELRLAKEKYYSHIDNDYDGDIKDVMDFHSERRFEARKRDVLGNYTGFHHLRSSIAQYEEIIRKIADTEPVRGGTEIITSSENTVEVEEIDHILGKEK